MWKSGIPESGILTQLVEIKFQGIFRIAGGLKDAIQQAAPQTPHELGRFVELSLSDSNASHTSLVLKRHDQATSLSTELTSVHSHSIGSSLRLGREGSDVASLQFATYEKDCRPSLGLCEHLPG